jgi:hypothetical protein
VTPGRRWRTLPGLILLAWAIACGRDDPAAEGEVEVAVSPSELLRAFAEDSAAAARRFAPATLVISGRPSSVFSGGPPGSAPSFTFQVDPRGTVHCSGDGLVHLLEDAGGGETVTVACDGSDLHYWPAPNESLELHECTPRPTAQGS